MSDKNIESNIKEHIDSGYIIVSLNGCLNYLNSDGTTCPVNIEDQKKGEA